MSPQSQIPMVARGLLVLGVLEKRGFLTVAKRELFTQAKRVVHRKGLLQHSLDSNKVVFRG